MSKNYSVIFNYQECDKNFKINLSIFIKAIVIEIQFITKF